MRSTPSRSPTERRTSNRHGELRTGGSSRRRAARVHGGFASAPPVRSVVLLGCGTAATEDLRPLFELLARERGGPLRRFAASLAAQGTERAGEGEIGAPDGPAHWPP